ncbi:MAG TPA: MFS transporter [Candidatus Thermoplasmatota archaeon]|nr:MFS transporter [Candidatus Thermoplasmatota archaeon]
MLERLRRGDYLRLLAAVYVATFLIRAAFGIVVITLKHHVASDNTSYGLVVAATPLAELLTVLFGVGVVIDRYGSKRILVTGLALGAISLFTLAATDNLLILGLINALHGVASAFILIPSLTVIAKYTPKESRGREMGAFNFVNLFGWIFGAAMGVYLLGELSPSWTFIIAGTFAVASMAYAWFAVSDPGTGAGAADHGHDVSFKDVALTLKEPSVVTLILPWLFAFIFIGGLLNIAPELAAPDNLTSSGGEGSSGLATGLRAVLILFVGSVFLVSQIFFGKLSDKYGREPLMILGTTGFLGFLLTVGYGFLQSPTDTYTDLTASVSALWPALFVFAVMVLAFPPAALAALADAGQEGRKATTMSLYTLVLAGGLIIGPPVAGAVQDAFGYWGVLLFFIVLAALMLAIVAGRYVESRLTHRAARPTGSPSSPRPEAPAAEAHNRGR